MSEDGTAVLEEQEKMTPGGLFTAKQYEDLKEQITEVAASREAEIPREPEQASDTPPVEPEAVPADEPSREPAPAEPEVSESAEPAEAADESPAAEFDDQLLARAEQMGFTKQAAQSFGTPDKLQTALTVLDQRLIGLHKPAPVAVEPAAAAAPAPAAAPAAQQLVDALTIDLDPEEHSPEIVEQFKKLHAHYEGRANQFEQVLVGLVTAMQAGQQQSEAQVVNQSIDGFNGDLKALITPEVRAQIQPTAVGLARGLAQAGLPVPSIPELVTRATHSLLSEQLLKNEHKRAADELSAKLDKRASQRTARPVQHHAAEPGATKEEKQKRAVQEIEAFKAERGMR